MAPKVQKLATAQEESADTANQLIGLED